MPHTDDYGNTPRAIGGISAAVRGFEAITFLDSDNWFEPNHIEHMVRLATTESAAVVAAQRKLWSLEGEMLGIDTFDSDGKIFCDTSCIFMTYPAFDLVIEWLMPKNLAIVGDRVFWDKVVNSGFKRVVSELPTVNYITDWSAHYKSLGLPVPSYAKTMIEEADGSLRMARGKDEGR
jgi:hypothetical protein